MKIIHFADLHLGVEAYGRIDPSSGLPSRLLDFLKALDELVEFALNNQVDLVLFCGDAYKSREPNQTQQREFAKRINRLTTQKIPIPVFLLAGNHDRHNASHRATAIDIFGTLAIPNVHISTKPDIYPIETRNGTIQIASLPWVSRGALLGNEERKNLNFEQINQEVQQKLIDKIAEHTKKLDPKLPAILAAHTWVSGAKIGSEKMMTIGQDPVLFPSNVGNPVFDYVALGHLHKHQILSSSQPPVVYAGSLERVDFSEEHDDKGFYLIEIEPTGQPDKRRVSFDFHPIVGRPFLTITINIEPGDTNPTATALRVINEQGDKVMGAIIRLQITLPAELEGQLRDNDIRNALKEAQYLTIAKESKQETRLRLGKLTAEEITPLEALKFYLESKKISPTHASRLLEYGEKLMEAQRRRQN